MKKLLFILLLASPCLASGPKYSYQDAHLNDEMNNIYKDESFPNIVIGRASTMTITQLNVSTITVSGKMIGNFGGTGGTNAAGYIKGTVVQRVVATSTTRTVSSGTGYTSVTPAASITPLSATHVIRITIVGQLGNQNPSTGAAHLAIFRDTTDLSGGPGFTNLAAAAFAQEIRLPATLIYLDSPASTSSITYTPKIKSDAAASAVWNDDNGTAYILLEEIAS